MTSSPEGGNAGLRGLASRASPGGTDQNVDQKLGPTSAGCSPPGRHNGGEIPTQAHFGLPRPHEGVPLKSLEREFRGFKSHSLRPGQRLFRALLTAMWVTQLPFEVPARAAA